MPVFDADSGVAPRTGFDRCGLQAAGSSWVVEESGNLEYLVFVWLL